jgi:hypothetical protein
VKVAGDRLYLLFDWGSTELLGFPASCSLAISNRFRWFNGFRLTKSKPLFAIHFLLPFPSSGPDRDR